MITHVHIQNFRSFLDAQVDLQPFSLVVGANGSGKSNLLKFFEVVSQKELGETLLGRVPHQGILWRCHTNLATGCFGFEIVINSNERFCLRIDAGRRASDYSGDAPWSRAKVPIFNLIAEDISGVEKVQPKAVIGPTGKGTTQVLDMLKNGDREELFDQIETLFRRYVPEVEKLSLRTVEEGLKQIQVRESGLNKPTPGPELSEGTRLILAVLTIIHQEKPPPIILLEDIDRGMHPRLFEYIAPLMKDIAVRTGVNILATTHNPYLVDAFQDDKKAVIIVEKKDGASTLASLEQKLEGIDYDKVDPDDLPLGQLWYSGLIGGTPEKISHRARV